jgi:hypothetical protein
LVGRSAVGGLTDVGFAPHSDLLLVVSSQGRGVFDGLSGKRIARDASVPEGDDPDWFDTFELTSEGIGSLAGQRIRTAGLHGGGLPLLTRDGWSVERLTLDWPDETLLLCQPWKHGYKPGEFVKVAVHSEVRAWGFSPTGRSLILAISSNLAIWSRSACQGQQDI